MPIVMMASDHHPIVREAGYAAWVRLNLDGRGFRTVQPDWEHPKGQVTARVVRSYWVAWCPGYGTDCANVQIVDDRLPLFFCVDCHDVGNDGKPYRVVFDHVAEIEALFSRRANPETRNWLRDETLDDLIREQVERGELNDDDLDGLPAGLVRRINQIKRTLDAK